MIDVPAGHLYLGETIDPKTRQRAGDAVLLESSDLTTHGVIVGMTGSGKTGLGVVLLEEALLAGVPTLIVDPKGDMGNLLLTFPELRPGDFAPWVEDGDPAEVATQWAEGLAGWGIEPSRIAALRDAAEFTIYTPGSMSGVPLNVIGSLRRPAEDADAETVGDEIEGFVSGLLGMVGVDSDPLSGADEFAARCRAAADDAADSAQVALQQRYESRIGKAREALGAAADRADQARAAQQTRRTSELATGAGSLLGAVLGGRRNARSMARDLGRVLTGRSRSDEAARRVQTADNRVQDKQAALASLEADLARDLTAIDDEWLAKAADVETVDVPLGKSDIRVTALSLVWVPAG